MSSKNKSNTKKSIKDLYDELKNIADKIENSDLGDIEENVVLYEKGLKIAEELKNRLNKVKNRVIQIEEK